jgi:hypothetical protein
MEPFVGRLPGPEVIIYSNKDKLYSLMRWLPDVSVRWKKLS